VAVGLVLLAALAYPLGVLGLFAYASFSGCFIDCGDPEPGVGLGWSAVAAVVLALPFAAALAVAGVRSRTAWWSAGAVVLLAVTTWDVLAVLA